jgi:methylamine dehydrogenase accessory protein MauD
VILTAAVIVLWILFFLVLLLVLVLYRQFGLLYLGSGGRIRLTGLEPGGRAPEGQTVVIDGRESTIEWSAVGSGRATLVVFGGPRCPICEKLIPELDEAVALWGELVDILFVDRSMDGSTPTRVLPSPRSWRYFLSPDDALYRDFDVEVSPYAFLVDAAGTVLNKRIVNSLDHLAWVVETAVTSTDGQLREVHDAPIRFRNARRVDAIELTAAGGGRWHK